MAALHEEDFHFCLVPSEHRKVNGSDSREELFAGSAVIHAN